MTVSYWHLQQHHGRESAPVVVIGAGVCGISAALELQQRGIEAVVLERGTVGCGASSRNAGFLMRGAADNYAAAVRAYGRDRARLLWRWTEENLSLLIEAGAESLGHFARRPSCLLALTEEERAEIDESYRLLIEDGFEARWVDDGDDAVWRSGRPLGGLINPNDAVCNSAELMGWLAGQLDRPVREHTEVARLSASGSSLAVVTNHSTIETARVLVCTNAWSGQLLPELEGVLVPRRGQMIAYDAPGVRLDCAYYANHGSEYLRTAGEGVVVVGGCRTVRVDEEVGCEDRTTQPVQSAIEGFTAGLLGSELAPMARWAGTMGFSPDGLPLIGPVPGWDDRVWVCGGFTGHGMSLARRSARAAVDEMLGGAGSPFPLGRVLGAPIG